MTIDATEEFFAVPLTWEESDKLVHFEVELSDATRKRLQLTNDPVILACDELEQTIVGFENFSRVFFLNFSAWLACRESGLVLRTTRKVRREDIPANYTVLVGAPKALSSTTSDYRVKLQIPDPDGTIEFARDVKAASSHEAGAKAWIDFIDDPAIPLLTQDSIAHIYEHPNLNVHVDLILNRDPEAPPSRFE